MAGNYQSRRRGVGLALVAAASMAMAVSAVRPAQAADEDQYLNAGRGVGSQLVSLQRLTLTMAAGATTQGTITVPAGTFIRTIRAETGTAFTGAPTNINLRAGSTAGNNDIMTDTDIKAAGHFTGTVVAGFDVTNAAANGPYTMNFQIAAVGGTNPAGTVYVFVDYAAPVR